MNPHGTSGKISLRLDSVLAMAWTQVKHNGGTCGVDGVQIETIRETPEKEEAFLEEIHEQLRTKTDRKQ